MTQSVDDTAGDDDDDDDDDNDDDGVNVDNNIDTAAMRFEKCHGHQEHNRPR